MGPNRVGRPSKPRPGQRDRLKNPVVVWEGAVRRVVAIPHIEDIDVDGTILKVTSSFALEEARTNAMGQKVWITITNMTPSEAVLVEDLATSSGNVPEDWFKDDGVPVRMHSVGPYR